MSPHDLIVSPDQVARYAGGARYRLHTSQLKTVQANLERAYQLVEPAFVYRIHEVRGIHEEGAVMLHNGLIFPSPPGKQDPGMKVLAFCVCTIGESLEETAGMLMSAGDALGGLFLDAAGVAFLEALSNRAYETLQQQAQERLLQTGCRFGPGYGGLDLSFQARLFDLVTASSIRVQLNESHVMSPAKSLSFVTAWTSSHMLPNSRHKCASCTLTHCPYRL